MRKSRGDFLERQYWRYQITRNHFMWSATRVISPLDALSCNLTDKELNEWPLPIASTEARRAQISGARKRVTSDALRTRQVSRLSTRRAYIRTLHRLCVFTHSDQELLSPPAHGALFVVLCLVHFLVIHYNPGSSNISSGVLSRRPAMIRVRLLPSLLYQMKTTKIASRASHSA